MTTILPNIQLFHVHVPKTAGTSLNAMFEHVFGQDFCNHDPDRLRSDPSVRMAAAHVTLRSARVQFPNARLVTVLREPESRMKSTFRHLYARRSWPGYAGIAPIIRDLIDSEGRFVSVAERIAEAEFRNRFDNLMVRYLTPEPVLERVTECHVRSAVDAIGTFSNVLFQDRFAEGVSRLFADLGAPDVQEVETNRAKSQVPLWDSVPEAMEPFLVHDRVLYAELLQRRDLPTGVNDHGT